MALLMISLLLALFHHLDENAELLAHLIHRAAIEVRDPRLDLDRRRDGAQGVLAWLLFVVDERAREFVAVARAAFDANFRFAPLLHLVHAVGAGLDRCPRQEG